MWGVGALRPMAKESLSSKKSQQGRAPAWGEEEFYRRDRRKKFASGIVGTKTSSWSHASICNCMYRRVEEESKPSKFCPATEL